MSPLTTSLVYSLWQAGAVWCVLQALHWLIPASRSKLRYQLALWSLFLVTALWIATWAYHGGNTDRPGTVLTAPSSFPREIAAVQAGTIYSRPTASVAFSWQQVVVMLWQAGVVLGFVRLAWSVQLARRIRAGATAVSEAHWNIALQELGVAMGHKLEIGLRASARVACPVVMGFLNPVIILPASALTGVSPGVIKATLAHEIAHLMRWDYVFNLVQIGIEALLFFNPFVWLISRSIRREREACCDQLASEVCGGTLTYSEALLWWGRGTVPLTPAAMAVDGNRPGLRDRIRRLFYPQEVPVERAEWRGVAGVAALVPLFLILSAFLVHATMSELTPTQRVALMEALTQPFRETASLKMSPGEAQRFSGTVVDDKGNAVANAAWSISSASLGDRVTGVTGPDGKYSGEAPRGLITLVVKAADFAPLAVSYQVGMSREDAPLVLSKGHDFRLQCINEEGKPIGSVDVGVESPEIPGWKSQATTDESGWATLIHQPDTTRATLTFEAPGYLTARRHDTRLSSSGLKEPVSLERIKPALIRVEDEITGLPIPGVLLRITDVQPNGSGFITPKWSSEGIMTDSEGTARLDGLNPTLSYDMTAKGTKRGMTFLFNPREGMTRTIRLPRERILNIKFLHLPEARVTVQYSQSSYAYFATLDVLNGEAQISLTGLMPNKVDLYFLKQWVHSPDLKDEVSEFVVDYDKIKPPAPVHVILKTALKAGQAPPTGSFWVIWALTQDAGVWDGMSVPIRDGVAEFDLPKGSWFGLTNAELLGGKIDESPRYQVQDNPSQIEVPFESAGIIRVKVLEPDGRLANQTLIWAKNLSDPQARMVAIKDGWSSSNDAREWYISPPIELDSNKYQVMASSGLRCALSQPFKLNAGNPIQDIVLTLPASQTKEIRVVDKEGNALGGVTLTLSMDVAPMGREPGQSLVTNSVVTDANGIARIEVGENSLGKFWLQPISTVLVPARYPMDFPATGELKIVLEKGKILVGRFIDRSTGGGFEGCWVQWMIPSTTIWSQRQPVAGDGSFEFDNAPDQEVFLSYGIPMGKRLVGKTEVRPGDQNVIFEIQDAIQAK